MTPDRSHPTEALSAYLDGELAGGERADVEAHLAACASCAAELADLRRLAAAHAGMAAPAVPADLAARLRARLGLPEEVTGETCDLRDADAAVAGAVAGAVPSAGVRLSGRSVPAWRRWQRHPFVAIAASLGAAAILWVAWQEGSEAPPAGAGPPPGRQVVDDVRGAPSSVGGKLDVDLPAPSTSREARSNGTDATPAPPRAVPAEKRRKTAAAGSRPPEGALQDEAAGKTVGEPHPVPLPALLVDDTPGDQPVRKEAVGRKALPAESVRTLPAAPTPAGTHDMTPDRTDRIESDAAAAQKLTAARRRSREAAPVLSHPPAKTGKKTVRRSQAAMSPVEAERPTRTKTEAMEATPTDRKDRDAAGVMKRAGVKRPEILAEVAAAGTDDAGTRAALREAVSRARHRDDAASILRQMAASLLANPPAPGPEILAQAGPAPEESIQAVRAGQARAQGAADAGAVILPPAPDLSSVSSPARLLTIQAGTDRLVLYERGWAEVWTAREVCFAAAESSQADAGVDQPATEARPDASRVRGESGSPAERVVLSERLRRRVEEIFDVAVRRAAAAPDDPSTVSVPGGDGVRKERTEGDRTVFLTRPDGSSVVVARDTDPAGAAVVADLSRRIQSLAEAEFSVVGCADLPAPRGPAAR
ncbi:MAG: zf-HC2 domain-containing protein [Acidobacteriota bacterium]